MSANEHTTQEIYTALKEVFVLLDHGDRNLFSEFDLSVARFNALMHLNKAEGVGPTELGSKLLCDKANVSRLLDGMEDNNLVERLPDRTDGRRFKIKVSPEGRRLWIRGQEAHEKFTQSRLACLAPEDQVALLDLLECVRAHLRDQLTEREMNPTPGRG